MIWMITTADKYELPLAVLNTLRECSEWLGIPLETLKTAFKRHGFYRSREYLVHRVQIE